MDQYLVVAVKVTGWTADEIGSLAGEMMAQTEKNEDHVEATQVLYADVHGEIADDDALEGILNVGMGN